MARRVKRFDSEENLHSQAAGYLRIRYPDALFRTDFAAGIKMTMGQAVKHKLLQAGRAWPDLQIAVPMYRDFKRDWHGQFIELKKDGTKLKRTVDARKVLKGETRLRRAGDWWDQHIEEQALVLEELRRLGYKAEFAVGFDDFKQQVDDYLNPAIGPRTKLGGGDDEVF